MPNSLSKAAVPKYTLRLTPAVRKTAQALSAKEGVSLNQFINTAVAEKVSHMEFDEWNRNRRRPTAEDIERALDLLNRGGGRPPDPGDELPEGYEPIVRRRSVVTTPG